MLPDYKNPLKKFYSYCFLLFAMLFIIISVACENKDVRKKKKSCEGCTDEAPWSAISLESCFTEKDSCEVYLVDEEECYKCN